MNEPVLFRFARAVDIPLRGVYLLLLLMQLGSLSMDASEKLS